MAKKPAGKVKDKKAKKAKKAAKKKSAARTGKRPIQTAAKSKRLSWLDDRTRNPLIDDYAREAESLVKAMADGRIDDHEVAEQEARLTDLMEEVEAMLTDRQHAKVTELLCEMAVYDMMQMLQALQASRPTAQFVG
jgi:N-acetylmuramoyl-L-alanine amidase CwlA